MPERDKFSLVQVFPTTLLFKAISSVVKVNPVEIAWAHVRDAVRSDTAFQCVRVQTVQGGVTPLSISTCCVTCMGTSVMTEMLKIYRYVQEAQGHVMFAMGWAQTCCCACGEAQYRGFARRAMRRKRDGGVIPRIMSAAEQL
jgi:hypothetical protein